MVKVSINPHENVTKLLPFRQAQVVRSLSELKEMMPQLESELTKIPLLYAQDGMGKKAIVYAHYFYGNSDWFITEWDKEDLMFGYVILNGDTQMSEFGYISVEELRSLPIELDFHWTPRSLLEVLTKEDARYE